MEHFLPALNRVKLYLHLKLRFSTQLMQQLATLVLLSATISATANSGQAPMNHINSGGDTTIHSSNRQAFSQPASNMPLMKKMDFHVGNSFFRNPWVAAPASTTARDGLGPLFNTNGCQNCHIRDGRGHAPGKNDLNAVSMLVRLSIPATTEKMEQQLITDGAIAEPVYGGQLQDFAIPGVRPEGQIDIHYSTIIKAFSDGETIELRKPTVKLHQLNYGELHANVMTSARIAPAMIGLGLLQAVDEQTLLALADEQDANGDGISGRINRVWDIEQQKTVVGRFGWKAGQPSLKQQNAAAFSGDMGLTTSLFPTQNCTATQQTICSAVPNGGQPEVSDNILDHVTFYSHNLAVPARRNHSDPDVKLGEKLFANAGCHNCHIDQMTTGESQFAWLSGQKIAPYTDLLLHDMGEGLADNRPEFMATGREWRTAPLWGIGLTKTVAGEMNFLHDGRARNLMEAVLWHGGEAEAATDAVLNMNSQERHALIQFLQSL